MENVTKNEARVMDFLIRHFDEKNSINEVARQLNLSPMGAHKILKKLEKANVVKPEVVNNSVCYAFNFEEESSVKLGEFVLLQNELNNYSKVQAEDLKRLKPFTLACILFGSVLTKGTEANDIDVIIVLKNRSSQEAKRRLEELKEIKPKGIHDILLTREELEINIKEKNAAIVDALRKGRVLWGSDVILEVVKNVSFR